MNRQVKPRSYRPIIVSEVYARKYMENLAQNVGKTLEALTISESVELLESAIDELETMREDLASRLESDY